MARRIGIDARIVTERLDGASRVVLDLLSHIPDDDNHYVIFYSYEEMERREARNVEWVFIPIKVSTLRNFFLAWRKINKYQLDVFFYCFVDLPFFIRARSFCLVYDLFFMKDARYFSIFKRILRPFINLLAWHRILSADGVITISEVAGQQISSLTLMDRNRVIVHLLGASRSLSMEHCVRPSLLPAEFVEFALYVGNNRNHKNLGRLIKATAGSSVNLVLAGSVDDRYPEPSSLIDSLNCSDRIRHVGRVSDSELAYLYKTAKFVIVPSIYEGFGLPLIEAASYKKLILCSDIPIFREVMGDSVLYFDCEAISDMASKIKVAWAGLESEYKYQEKAFQRSRDLTVDAFCRCVFNSLSAGVRNE